MKHTRRQFIREAVGAAAGWSGVASVATPAAGADTPEDPRLQRGRKRAAHRRRRVIYNDDGCAVWGSGGKINATYCVPSNNTNRLLNHTWRKASPYSNSPATPPTFSRISPRVRNDVFLTSYYRTAPGLTENSRQCFDNPLT